MSLEIILKAGIAIVSVTTTDVLNLESVLNELIPEGATLKQHQPRVEWEKNTVYYAVGTVETQAAMPTLYASISQADATLVVVNPAEPNPIYFDAGVLPTPTSLLYETLSEFMSENDFKELLPAIGGLTIKDVIELLMVTQCEYGYTDSDSVMRVRLEYLQRTQGLDIVDTELKGYVPGIQLKKFTEYNKQFFLGEYDHRLRPRGLIVHGVPGTGKTQGAKYLAKKWGVPLFRLDATVQSKWIGESEQNLTQALKQLEQYQPCVLLIDEAEKLFVAGSDQGVSEKLLATMLWWMQEHREPVFLIATANNIEALPAELLRKGRFDEIFFVDLPTPGIRRAIFEVHLRKRRFKPENFHTGKLAAAAEGYTGSEIEQAVVSALHESFARNVKMDTELVLKAVRSTRPLCVTMREYVNRIRQWAKERCVSVD